MTTKIVIVDKCGKGNGCIITILPAMIQKEKLELLRL